MRPNETHEDLLQHLCHSRGLGREEAKWILQEVMSYFTETRDEFIRRRHRELQGAGLANAAIYRQLADELGQRRFPIGATTERQIRRIIYG